MDPGKNDVARKHMRRMYSCGTGRVKDCLHGCSVLELLKWRLGTFVLGGTAAISRSLPFVQPFTELSLASRERILQGWAQSSIPKFLEV